MKRRGTKKEVAASSSSWIAARHPKLLTDIWTQDAFADLLPRTITAVQFNSTSFRSYASHTTTAAQDQDKNDRSRKRKCTLSTRLSIVQLNQQLCRSNIDPHMLVSPYPYDEVEELEKKPQPFRVIVHPQVGFLTDVHSHLCDAEVIGLLAGTWDANALSMTITAPFPCSSVSRQEDDGSMDVELDPAAEYQAREYIQQQGMRVVGWYHSHPRFRPDPSITDIFNQWQYQQLTRDAETGVDPWVGLIVSTYDPSSTNTSAHHQWFNVVRYCSSESGRAKVDINVPMLLRVETAGFACNSSEGPTVALRIEANDSEYTECISKFHIAPPIEGGGSKSSRGAAGTRAVKKNGRGDEGDGAAASSKLVIKKGGRIKTDLGSDVPSVEFTRENLDIAAIEEAQSIASKQEEVLDVASGAEDIRLRAAGGPRRLEESGAAVLENHPEEDLTDHVNPENILVSVVHDIVSSVCVSSDVATSDFDGGNRDDHIAMICSSRGKVADIHTEQGDPAMVECIDDVYSPNRAGEPMRRRKAPSSVADSLISSSQETLPSGKRVKRQSSVLTEPSNVSELELSTFLRRPARLVAGSKLPSKSSAFKATVAAKKKKKGSKVTAEKRVVLSKKSSTPIPNLETSRAGKAIAENLVSKSKTLKGKVKISTSNQSKYSAVAPKKSHSVRKEEKKPTGRMLAIVPERESAKKKVSGKTAPRRILSLTTLLSDPQSSSSLACCLARELICKTSPSLRFMAALSVAMGLFYCAHPRRVDMAKKWKDTLSKADKLRASAEGWLIMLGLSPDDSCLFMKRMTAFLEACWSECPKLTKKQAKALEVEEV